MSAAVIPVGHVAAELQRSGARTRSMEAADMLEHAMDIPHEDFAADIAHGHHLADLAEPAVQAVHEQATLGQLCSGPYRGIRIGVGERCAGMGSLEHPWHA